jgi:glycine/D-amino acid oxidase-like deaminating enzyme
VYYAPFLDATMSFIYYVHITHKQMATTDDFAAEVLIVGAGAAGLTLAIELARRGISFRLIDKLDSPFGGSRGKVFSREPRRSSRISASSTGWSQSAASTLRSVNIVTTAATPTPRSSSISPPRPPSRITSR